MLIFDFMTLLFSFLAHCGSTHAEEELCMPIYSNPKPPQIFFIYFQYCVANSPLFWSSGKKTKSHIRILKKCISNSLLSNMDHHQACFISQLLELFYNRHFKLKTGLVLPIMCFRRRGRL